MDLCLASSFLPPESPLLGRKCDVPAVPRRWLSTNPTPPTPRTRLVITAKKREVIEGVGDEMNSIASQNLDFAPARRRVRAAFTEFQQQLDH